MRELVDPKEILVVVDGITKLMLVLVVVAVVPVPRDLDGDIQIPQQVLVVMEYRFQPHLGIHYPHHQHHHPHSHQKGVVV